jgi:glycerol kinase
MEECMSRYVLAIDQGTTSTRCMIFDRSGAVVAADQREHRQIFPRPGWVEHDPEEIWQRTVEVFAAALAQSRLQTSDLAAIGITNQRETTVLWNRRDGRPIANAMVWQDTRTDAIVRELAGKAGIDRFRPQTGLPLATYFSGPKIRWLLDTVPGARAAAEAGELAFGTIDSWLAWNLTGATDGGLHVTDVTNASRTMLMNLETTDWDEEMLAAMQVPRAILPTIHSSSTVYGECRTLAPGVPLAGILGDQHAATVGQACYTPGEAKNTYGTGNFLLLNTGSTAVQSHHGLITTPAYRFGDQPVVWALEGSIAVTGALVQWLRDNLGLIDSAPEVETLAASVADNGGMYLVPAFSGLFAPYWRSDARGVMVGLTRYINRGHIARAALEASAYQTRDVVEAMQQDSGVALRELRVDGGMVANDLLMQFQADILGVPVERPQVAETTALGTAYAAGLAVGYWRDTDEMRRNRQVDKIWEPRMSSDERDTLYAGWQKALQRSLDWVE